MQFKSSGKKRENMKKACKKKPEISTLNLGQASMTVKQQRKREREREKEIPVFKQNSKIVSWFCQGINLT